MTILDKAREMGIAVNSNSDGAEWCCGCPYEHGLSTEEADEAFCNDGSLGKCPDCYAREYVPVVDTTANPAEAKYDAGKPRPTLVPMQIVYDIAEVREYGTRKYHDPENWRNVELDRYVNAFLRHALALAHDITAKDAESGIEHYKHAACNLAFIAEMLKAKGGADYDC